MDVEVFATRGGEKNGVNMNFFTGAVIKIHVDAHQDLILEFEGGGQIVVPNPVIYVEPETH
jgi:hypothetical protein